MTPKADSKTGFKAVMRLEYGVLATLGLAVIGGVFGYGRQSERIDNVQVAQKADAGRIERKVDKVEERVRRVERGQERQEERSKAAKGQRDRIEGKIDGLIRRLTPPMRPR